MKFCLIALFAVALASPAVAQSDGQQPVIGSATIPVTRTPGPGDMPGTGVAITRPVPESTIQPVPLAPSQTPEQQAADQALRKQADDDLSSYSTTVSDACDGSFKARIDWTTVSPLQTHRYSPADACGAALQAIEEMCQNPEGKERVAKEIKSVICTTSAQPSIEMHGGTLVYTIDWQSAEPGQRVYAWLAAHL